MSVLNIVESRLRSETDRNSDCESQRTILVRSNAIRRGDRTSDISMSDERHIIASETAISLRVRRGYCGFPKNANSHMALL